ncbi:SusC/RagA family TonB-linked outer membrane protein [Cellulophaga sp. BC115SP]|uniref:SusC/RagA family TonB-linked outer membrane protein n=1 Tax=Cellulophaga sp. BC115SP TaxID=2683263 RepID=UPI001412937A|nr:SusC/RagA family TonB-linked outer membrane protein [Cellulophaga sp. BC115SP]NBB30526.1 SusC/RagA family TonB-linked outer membrane protein [Cellulophaga sp. BC115SP]
MKFIKILLFLCTLMMLQAVTSRAQDTPTIQIKATVFGVNNQPLKGAVVTSAAENSKAVTTDAFGTFEYEVAKNDVLSISAKGFETKYITITKAISQISLTPEKTRDLIHAAFREVEKQDLLGGVASVNVKELLNKNYFTNTLDGMEAFASGFNGNSNWGMGNYLFMIDGVPRETGNVAPTEIEEIVFLKGANAVALYGSRAAKGVVNVITKRGEVGKRRFDLRVNSGINIPKSYPKYLGSAEYMTMYNEARRNDGLTDLYSELDIYNYGSGRNKYRFPNVDFYSSDYLKNVFTRYDATAEISGGNERVRYYTNLGYSTTGSLLNFGEAKNNNNSDRLNFRGNLDIQLNEYISMNADATAIFYTGRGVNTDYWGNAATVRPNRFAPLIPIDLIEKEDAASQIWIQNSNNLIDGKYLLGGTQLDQTNPIATIYAGGNNQYSNRQFQFNTGLKADLRNVLKGLSFRTGFAVDYATAYSLSYNYSYATYSPTWNNYSGTDLISSLTVYNQDAKSGTQNVSGNWYRQTIAFSGQLNYDRTFGTNHNFSAILLANGFQQSESAVYHRTSNANLGLLASYNYNHKYYVDLSTAYIHSAKLPPSNRQAFSPSVSLGWRLSREEFLKNSHIVNDLKLTASASILNTDLDINDYYLYQGFYTGAGSWYGWKDGTGIQATESRRGDNPNMKFPRREEINIGLEGTFFNRLLNVNGTFFMNKITGNIIQASVLFPSYFTTGWPVSSFIPYVNYNEDKRVGFDFSANLNKKIGEVNWNLGINGTYYQTTAVKRAELYENAYQNRQGKPLDGIWGLQNLGFFQDDNDIKNSPSQTFGQVKPGDIKYKDQNGDGIIDSRDEVFLGKGGWFGAPFTMGVTLSAQWKKLTFLALGVGRFGGNAMRNNSYFWVYGENKYSEVVRNRWTEATKLTATYPRLTTLSSDNNFRSSDFWMYSTSRFDLSKVQITYDLTDLLKMKSFVRELGVYVNGFNLWTFSENRETLELNVGSSPQTRFFNLGVKALF